MKKVKYDGNKQETYNLLLDDKIVAELLIGEDGVIELVDNINSWLVKQSYKNYIDPLVVIQNDDDKLGVIVDIYEKNGKDWAEGITYWFDDYV